MASHTSPPQKGGENFITDEVKTAGEVAQDIIACYNGAAAEIETIQRPQF